MTLLSVAHREARVRPALESPRFEGRACAKRIACALHCLCLLHGIATTATADSGNVEDILPLANDPNDPIGLEHDPGFDRAAASSKQPAKAAAITPEDRARYGPTPPPFAAKSGEALTAVPSVTERSHRVSLELYAGLALLEAELSFENSADKPAEIEYRLAVPDDAALAGLDACNSRGCRSGVLAPPAERGAAYDDAVRARGPKPLAQQLPLAHAYKVRDARGAALIVRAAAVEKDLPLTLRLRYATAAPVHGGVARLVLPPRGMDPRAAPLELSLRASDLTAVSSGVRALAVGAPALKSDAWQPIEVHANAGAAGTRSVWQFPCGSQQCARAYVSTPQRTAAAADLILAIDASPSTEGAARSRMVQAISAILARAPQGTRVRALRFASKVETLIGERKDAAQVQLSQFGSVAFEAELGSATRFESAWETIKSWGPSKANGLIVIVGDGGVTRGKAKPFDAARRAGYEVSVVNVADRASLPALVEGAHLTGGTVIDAGEEADAALRGGTSDRLEERLAALFAPVAVPRPTLASSGNTRKLPALRAGESLTIEGVSRGTWTLQAGASARAVAPPQRLLLAMTTRGQEKNHTATGGVLDAPLTALLAVDPHDLGRAGRDRPDATAKTSCDPRGPALRQGGLSSDAKPVALAAERGACAAPPKKQTKKAGIDEVEPSTEAGSGMPSSPLLGMLRQRIIPVARGCFRKDRAGRADYQVRAVFSFELAEREVISAEVTGKITDALRDCLLSAIDDLAVPRFSGRVVVHYPLVTERETLPSQIELTPEAAEKVDSLLTP